MENPIKVDDLGVPLFSETSNERVRGFHDSVAVSLFSGQPTHSFKDMARNLGDEKFHQHDVLEIRPRPNEGNSSRFK